MPILKVAQTVDGTPRNWEIEIGDREATLGRDKGCTIPLDDRAVSRNHARLIPTAQGVLLRDLDSSNGTWVNGSRITEVLLRDGDEVRIGGCAMRFVLPDQAGTVMPGAKALQPQVPPPTPRPRQAAPPPERAPLPAAMANHPTPPLPLFAQSASAHAAPRSRPAHAPAPRACAGFWIRFLASVLDSLILGGVMLAVLIPGFLRLRSMRYLGNDFLVTAWGMAGLMATLALLYILIFWTVKGATPGKWMLGLRIVREDGLDRLGWGRALLRFLGYGVDGLTFCIGFIMIAFTARKRGLHDMIAGTTVVKIR